MSSLFYFNLTILALKYDFEVVEFCETIIKKIQDTINKVIGTGVFTVFELVFEFFGRETVK